MTGVGRGHQLLPDYPKPSNYANASFRYDADRSIAGISEPPFPDVGLCGHSRTLSERCLAPCLCNPKIPSWREGSRHSDPNGAESGQKTLYGSIQNIIP